MSVVSATTGPAERAVEYLNLSKGAFFPDREVERAKVCAWLAIAEAMNNIADALHGREVS